jgi:hypothetical protein
MKKYSVEVTHIADDYFWNVYEKQTDQIIRTFYFEDDAKETARFMEKGGAFDGFTPAFMLTPVALPGEDINQRFQRIFS